MSKLFITRTILAFPCYDSFGISSWKCDCWPVSESAAENILASNISSESPKPHWWSWWFFAAGNESGWLRCSSNYSIPWGVFRFFCKRWLVLILLSLSRSSSVAVKARRCQNSFFICSPEMVLSWTTPEMLPIFHKCSNTLFASVKAESEHDNGNPIRKSGLHYLRLKI